MLISSPRSKPLKPSLKMETSKPIKKAFKVRCLQAGWKFLKFLHKGSHFMSPFFIILCQVVFFVFSCCDNTLPVFKSESAQKIDYATLCSRSYTQTAIVKIWRLSYFTTWIACNTDHILSWLKIYKLQFIMEKVGYLLINPLHQLKPNT